MNDLKSKFECTYLTNRWGSPESRSGEGSSWQYAHKFAIGLLFIINQYNIQKIYDCSCGDWNWMQHISQDFVDYTGNDIVPKIIEENSKTYSTERIKFTCGDMLDNLNKINGDIDLIICRHTLEHLSDDYVEKSLNTFKVKTSYALITSMNYTTSSIKFNDFDVDGFKARQVNLDLECYKNIIGTPILKILDKESSYSTGTNFPEKGTFGYLYKFS